MVGGRPLVFSSTLASPSANSTNSNASASLPPSWLTNALLAFNKFVMSPVDSDIAASLFAAFMYELSFSNALMKHFFAASELPFLSCNAPRLK